MALVARIWWVGNDDDEGGCSDSDSKRGTKLQLSFVTDIVVDRMWKATGCVMQDPFFLQHYRDYFSGSIVWCKDRYAWKISEGPT